MAVLQWSEAFALGMPTMDETHLEFVNLLAEVVNASDAQLMPLWQALIDHTDAHFAREDGWMTATGFSADVVLLYAAIAIVLVILGSVFIRLFWCKYI